jgi:hypothetical protein
MSANSQAGPTAGCVPDAARSAVTRQITVRLRPDELARLKQYGQRHDVKSQRIIVDAIREYLDRRQGRLWT